jgi:Tfp pilus assembly protein PilF
VKPLQVGLIGLLSLQWLAVQFPERLWGIHHLAFLPSTVSLGLTGVAAATLALSLHAESCAWIGRKLQAWPVGPRGTMVLLVASMGGLFTHYPVAHRLLGDSGLSAGWVASGVRADSLSVQVFSWLYAHWGIGRNGDTSAFFIAVTAILGCLYVLCSLVLARRCGTDAAGRIFAFLLMVSIAPLLLFFGYPEHYAPVITGLVLVAAAIVAWDGRHLSWLLLGWSAGLFTAVAHHLAAFCLPPLVLATLLHLRHAHRWSTRALIGLGLGLGAMGLALAGWVLHDRASLLLPFAAKAPYGVFGLGHLMDATNGLLLMAPLHPVVIGTAAAARRGMLRDPVVVALGLFTVAGALAMAAVNPVLGALDWDLMSMFSVPLAALTAVGAGRYLPPGLRLPGLLVMAGASLLHLAPWFLVNHDPTAAADMVEAMVRHDPHHDAERRMKLAVKFEDGGFDDAAVRQYIAALRSKEDDTDGAVLHARLVSLRNLGFLLYERGDIDSALDVFDRLGELLPEESASLTARSLLSWHAGEQRNAVRLVLARLLTDPLDVRAREAGQHFSRSAASDADRLLANLALSIAAGDTTSTARAIARLPPDVLGTSLTHDVRTWLALARSSRP